VAPRHAAEVAARAPLVLAHHADAAEAHPGVAADRPFVGGRRVDRDPVMAAPLEQVPGEQRDGLPPRALALEAAAEVDVDARVPGHRVVLLVVLDSPGRRARRSPPRAGPMNRRSAALARSPSPDQARPTTAPPTAQPGSRAAVRRRRGGPAGA